ncbi:MAG: hypothetical protein IKU23_03530 [Clostridia bacterium]|nr:hypothetical protein [Clostridia bacterium]
MKKLLAGILVVFMLCCFIGCSNSANDTSNSNTSNSENSNTNSNGSETSNYTDDDVSVEQESSEESKEEEKLLSASELEDALSLQPLVIVSTRYLIQHDEYKALYPDMLQAVLRNNSYVDIKDALVAFVAWDSNNLPVKIEGKYDFGSTTYVKECRFSDINLVPGQSFGDNSGMALSSDCNTIDKFKAIVVSYETFDGETWTNPLYDNWKAVYEGKRYTN